jgi:hypothetical protein
MSTVTFSLLVNEQLAQFSRSTQYITVRSVLAVVVLFVVYAVNAGRSKVLYPVEVKYYSHQCYEPTVAVVVVAQLKQLLGIGAVLVQVTASTAHFSSHQHTFATLYY